MKKTFAAAATTLALMGCSAFAMDSTKNVVENAVASPDHTTLVAAVQAGGLVETLAGPGPFTVFAPTNAAFAALPEGTVETLLKPENKDQLVQILTCHVVGAEVMSEALVSMIGEKGGMLEVETLGGCKLTAMVEDGKVMIADENGNKVTVAAADIDASNGVIHVIDGVILPKG